MDTAATLSAGERDMWLADITEREPDVAPLLRKLLSAQRRVETNDILATLPRLQPTVDARSTGAAGSLGAHIGPFELIEPLGRGGMGSVWRARYIDGRMKRDVAVKLPATSDNPAALASLTERFARERDFLAQLEHPNIARLYDTGISDSGQPYLAMEYVAGEPIDSYCNTHRLTIKARLTLYLQVLDAVEFAHRRLVLHRDLKPGNVLVDASGQVRLLDFGVAKLLPETIAAATSTSPISAGTDLTEMAGAALTLAYAAPEQLNHGALSTATDVYALGVMLYRLLTATAPYQPKRDTRSALEEAVISAAPTAASLRHVSDNALAARQTNATALRKSLSGDIDTLLAKALKKRPDERYPTATALAEDIRRHLNKKPILARPDSLWYRANRFIARNRVAVAASALGVTALAATTGMAVWQASVATASAARANKEAARAVAAQRFLAGLFASADPEQSKASTLTAQQLLEGGLAAADRDLRGDPETHALVLQQIGDIYRRMGMPQQLLATQKRRVEVLEAFDAADADTLVDAQLELGRALGDTEQPEDNKAALPRLKAAYETAIARAAKPERVVWALSLIADQYRVESDFAAAQDYAQRALSEGLRSLSNPSRFLAAAYEISALVARDQRRIPEARELLGKAIAIDATGQGRGPIDQVITRTFLANVEMNDGEYLAAHQQSLAIIELARANFGDLQANLAPALRLAAFSAARAGDLPTAHKLVATPMDAEVASKDAVRAGLAHYARARIATLQGEYERAHAELAAAASGLKQSGTWASRLSVATIELALREGATDAALTMADALRQAQSARLGATHPSMDEIYVWLAVAQARNAGTLGSQSPRWDAARQHIEQACALYAPLREAHPSRVRCEAYRTLLSATLTVAAKRNALQSLESMLLRGNNPKLPIIQSLRDAQTFVSTAEIPSANAPLFPILE